MCSQEKEQFKKRMVLVVCWAGSDRSKYIAEELNRRGYVASYVGVNKNHNYVTEQDLLGIGTVIFADKGVKREFKQDRGLNRTLKANEATVHIMDITESDKDRAKQSGNEEGLKQDISNKLNLLGFRTII